MAQSTPADPYRTEDAIVDEPPGGECPVCGDAIAARAYKTELECRNPTCGLLLVRAESGKWQVWNPSEWEGTEEEDPTGA